MQNSALVTALILERPLCLRCIADKSGLKVEAAETVIAVIRRSLDVHRQDAARCHACGATAVVFSIHRPSN